MDRRHTMRVAALAAQVETFYQQKRPFHIYHGSTNSTRILSFNKHEMIDASGLDRVLSIDAKRRVAIVEPNVPMDKLIAATRKFGLIPPVVPEFPGITVGGAVQGGAGESSSFKWGCFNNICTEYEMILANGRVVKATAHKNADLFHGTAGSYGSLGLMTAIKITLIPDKEFVNLTYIPIHSLAEATRIIQAEVVKDHGFIDGIMFSAYNGVIITGECSNVPAGKTVRFLRAHDEWFYLHAQDISQAGKKHTESVPLTDYLFRYDRGAFWVGSYAFERLQTSFNRFTRWLLNPILHTRKLYDALQASGVSQEYIVQDLALPQEAVTKFMQFVDKRFNIYPLWLCPLRVDFDSPSLSSHLETRLVINVGVWGPYPGEYDDFVAANRELERKVRSLGGKKWFYAHAYYTEEEFWDIYDKSRYDRLRKKYRAQSLPTVYQKVSVTKRYPVNDRRGVLRALFGLPSIRINKR
jgi:delta24-sterol reductase